MILYIAEKPSLGRAIAEALPKPHRKAEGCIYAGNGDCVTWCVGHLLEQAEPDAYDAKFKQWKFEDLPIIPDQWQLKPKSNTRKQLSVLRKLVKDSDQIVHAGDPDREGQLLVDQVIDYLKVSGPKRENIQRVLISDLNVNAVKKALGQLKSNKTYVPLSVSALARSRADWLYGINMTRAYTLQGRKVNYQGVLSVGRVQTPILGLVARRDAEIAAFVSKPFYQVIALVVTDERETNEGETFKAKWLPSEACEPYMDEEGRVLSKALAENIVSRIQGQAAHVQSTRSKKKRQPPPLPYNLSSLQIDAAKRYGLSAKQVLDCCQSLYEKYKLITYPRSDCRFLPVEHFAQRASVLAVIANNSGSGDLAAFVQGADQQIKSKAWNDSKVDAHHAIIPTEKKFDIAKLPLSERNVYQLIARQYIAQFYPACEIMESEIKLKIAGGNFIASANKIVLDGWKTLFQNPSKKENSNDAPLNTSLPKVKTGDSLHCKEGVVLEKQTTPPKHFDDASLLAAMTGIARYVKDPELRKILKDTDGLGTEATRAGIIELLFKREFLMRRGKKICVTETGSALVNSLPESATTPDMTANWEIQLDAISQRSATYKDFMTPLCDSLKLLISSSEQHLPMGLKGQKSNSKTFYKKRSKKMGASA